MIANTHLLDWPRGGECNAVDFISVADLINAETAGVEDMVDLGLTRAAGVGLAPAPIRPRGLEQHGEIVKVDAACTTVFHSGDKETSSTPPSERFGPTED